jgi:amino acid transporter
MASRVGASAAQVFLISTVGIVATASSLAQFASIDLSTGSFITYVTRAVGTRWRWPSAA